MYVAYYLHWPQAEILDLDHRNREAVIAEITQIHTEMAQSNGSYVNLSGDGWS